MLRRTLLILGGAVVLAVVLPTQTRFGPLHVLFIALLVVFVVQLVASIVNVLSGTSSPLQNEQFLARSDMLVKPVTVKSSSHGGNARLRYGLSCMQGWRRSMEDAHTSELGLGAVADGKGGTVAGDAQHALFAVFDGHRGAATAAYAAAALPRFLVGAPGYRSGRLREALVEAYVTMDRQWKQAQPTEMSGCTAVSLLVTPTELYCANAGDSRCVLCRNGRAVPMSIDHKPQLPSELRRIQRAGSFVFRGRVQGVLALSRAIGDFSFKQRVDVPWEEQAVTCVPEVQAMQLEPRDEFVVIACDGIWDVMSSQDVVTFVRGQLARGSTPQAACEALMDSCLSPRPLALGCDNMSVIIVVLQPAGATS